MHIACLGEIIKINKKKEINKAKPKILHSIRNDWKCLEYILKNMPQIKIYKWAPCVQKLSTSGKKKKENLTHHIKT